MLNAFYASKIWNSQTGLGIETLTGHTAAILDLKFSADGKYLASAAEDKLVKIWKTATFAQAIELLGNP